MTILQRVARVIRETLAKRTALPPRDQRIDWDDPNAEARAQQWLEDHGLAEVAHADNAERRRQP